MGMFKRFGGLVMMTAGLLSAAGCSSADASGSPPDDDQTPIHSVSGAYVADNLNPNAPYEALDFSGVRYTGWKANCSTFDGCVERGTFTLDSDSQTITFHDEEHGTSQTFGIRGRAGQQPLMQRTAGIHPQIDGFGVCLIVLAGLVLLNRSLDKKAKAYEQAYNAGYKDAEDGKPKRC
jgi:hypothetical protein